MSEQMQIDQGWIRGVRRLPSANANERPDGCAPTLLVIHNISLPPGEFGGGYIEKLFTNGLDCAQHPWFERLNGLCVSAHLLIDRGGELIQFVPFERRAWHAGESCFEGRVNCNDFSIGIELEGTDDLAYTDLQYATLLDVSAALLREYPGLAPERIVGHADIAPERKTDPGSAFEWDRYRQALAAVVRSAESGRAGGER